MRDWKERFKAFEQRKTREALAAKIAPLVTDVDRGAGGRIAIGNDWTRRLFDGPFYVSPPSPDLPSASLVFVRSRDRNTVATDPSILGGGDADLHLIYEGLSRAAADAVLAGAGTVRGGDVVFSVWRPALVALRASLGLPRHPVQIIATLRGMTFEGLIVNAPDVRVMLLTVPAAVDVMSKSLADRPWITPVVMPTPADLAGAFRDLRARGIATISCIGGRTLARQLLDAGLVQDLYLTTSAKDAGEPNTPLSSRATDGDVRQRKHGTGEDAGVTFETISVSGRP